MGQSHWDSPWSSLAEIISVRRALNSANLKIFSAFLQKEVKSSQIGHQLMRPSSLNHQQTKMLRTRILCPFWPSVRRTSSRTLADMPHRFICARKSYTDPIKRPRWQLKWRNWTMFKFVLFGRFSKISISKNREHWLPKSSISALINWLDIKHSHFKMSCTFWKI